MKNDERDENSPVEMIEGRMKRLHTNGIDGRKRLKLREEEGGRAGKTKATWKGKLTNILKRKTPVKIIEERKQKLRMSRMDTRLRTPAPRRKGWVGGKNKHNFGQGKQRHGGRTED